MFAIKQLLGKKDKEGHNPKIMVCSKNLTFLAKTWTNAFEQNLQMTNSEYRYDKAKNIMAVGNVEIILVPTEEPSNIYGYSTCFKGGTKVMTSNGEKNIEDITNKDYVLTRKGFKKVKHAWCNGEKDCIEVNIDGSKIICTPDHRFIDSFNNEIEAKDLIKTTSLVKIDTKEWQKWLDTNGLIGQDEELNESVSSVGKSLKQISMPSLKPAHLIAKTLSVVGHYKVYDIEVEDCHEFFANGVLVHNCLALVDELDELPTDIAMEAVKSINDRVRQQIEGFRSPFIAFATTSQGLKGMYQTVMHFKKSSIGYVLMRARTRDNTYLPADYVKNLYSIYNEKETKCLLEGVFLSIDSGLVFPDYDPAKNMLDIDLFGTEAIAEDDTIYIGQDFNSFGNHAIALVVKKFSDGNVCIVAIKDYVFPDIRRAPQVFRYDFPTQRIVWIPDMTYKEHFTEFKKELRNFNITIAYRSCNPLVNDRTFACNKLFFAERLFITPICKNLEKALLTHQRDPKTGMPMKGGVNAPDHDSDAFGMAVHYLLSWNRDLKPLYEVTLQYIYSKRRARGADATELEVGSQLLSADKLKAIPLKTAPNVEENAFNA